MKKQQVLGHAGAVFLFGALAAIFSLSLPSQQELLLAIAYLYGAIVHNRLAVLIGSKIK